MGKTSTTTSVCRGGVIMYVGPYEICFVFFLLVFPRGFRLQAHLRVSNRHYAVRICNTAYRLKNTQPCSSLGNCLALYFWRSLNCLNYLEAMHLWPHALATPPGLFFPNKTVPLSVEFDFNNSPICDILLAHSLVLSSIP